MEKKASSTQTNQPTPAPEPIAAPQPVAPPQPLAAAPIAPPAPQPVGPQDQRNYFTMMLIAILMPPTGFARAYIGEQIGWIRFWIYVASIILSFVPYIGLIGNIGMTVALVWGIVDVFLLRSRVTDGFNQPLVATNTDRKWANNFFVYFVVLLIITALVFLLGLVFISVLMPYLLADPRFYLLYNNR